MTVILASQTKKFNQSIYPVMAFPLLTLLIIYWLLFDSVILGNGWTASRTLGCLIAVVSAYIILAFLYFCKKIRRNSTGYVFYMSAFALVMLYFSISSINNNLIIYKNSADKICITNKLTITKRSRVCIAIIADKESSIIIPLPHADKIMHPLNRMDRASFDHSLRDDWSVGICSEGYILRRWLRSDVFKHVKNALHDKNIPHASLPSSEVSGFLTEIFAPSEK